MSGTDKKISKLTKNYTLPTVLVTQNNNFSNNNINYTQQSHIQDNYLSSTSKKIILDNNYQQYIQQTSVPTANLSTMTNDTTLPVQPQHSKKYR